MARASSRSWALKARPRGRRRGLAVIALACELTAWLQMLTLIGHPARRWEPKRLRLRLFSTAGRLAHHSRQTVLHLSNSNRWTSLLLEMITTLRGLPAPAN